MNCVPIPDTINSRSNESHISCVIDNVLPSANTMAIAILQKTKQTFVCDTAKVGLKPLPDIEHKQNNKLTINVDDEDEVITSKFCVNGGVKNLIQSLSKDDNLEDDDVFDVQHSDSWESTNSRNYQMKPPKHTMVEYKVLTPTNIETAIIKNYLNRSTFSIIAKESPLPNHSVDNLAQISRNDFYHD